MGLGAIEGVEVVTMDAEDVYDDIPDGVWEQCWQCHGEGGFHNCGEDCCVCLHPEADLNETCEECGGKGGYYV